MKFVRFDNNEFGLEWRRGPRQSVLGITFKVYKKTFRSVCNPLRIKHVDFGSDLALAYIDLKRDCIFYYL